jgi:hypothetical protein
VAEPLLPLVSYRVVNRFTGATVIAKLNHLHQSRLTVNAMQLGGSGSIAVGTIEIPLPPPFSDAYALFAQDWSVLDYSLRVEAYWGNEISGTPWTSGVVIGIKKSFGTYTLLARTDPWLLASTLTWPGAGYVGGTQFDWIAWGELTGTNIVNWSDNFSAYNAANYTVTGAWSAGTVSFAASTLPALKSSAVAAAHVMRTVNIQGTGGWAGGIPNQWAEVLVTTAANMIANEQIGFRAVDSAGNVFLFVLIVSATAGYLDAVWYKNGVLQATVTKVATNNPAILHHLALGSQESSNAAVEPIAFTVDGALIFSAVNLYTGVTQNLINVGLYWIQAGGGTDTGYFTNFFVNYLAGTGAVLPLGAGGWLQGMVSHGINYFADQVLTIPRLSALDLIAALNANEGFYTRFTSAAMTAALGATHGNYGTLDYAAAPGVDRSKQILIREGDNLIDVDIEPNADLFATAVAGAGMSGTGAAGSAISYWRDVAKTATYGILEDNVPSLAAVEVGMLA